MPGTTCGTPSPLRTNSLPSFSSVGALLLTSKWERWRLWAHIFPHRCQQRLEVGAGPQSPISPVGRQLLLLPLPPVIPLGLSEALVLLLLVGEGRCGVSGCT